MSKPKKGNRFDYSLETLLKVRKIREDQEKEKLNAAEKKVQEEKLNEQRIKKEQSDHLNYVRELLGSKELPQLNTIQMHQHHVKTMEGKVKEQKKVVKTAEQKREEKREDLIKASKEKQIIKKDREKTRVKWKKMMDKIDSQFLDEISSIKFATKRIKEKNEEEEKQKEEEEEEEEEEKEEEDHDDNDTNNKTTT